MVKSMNFKEERIGKITAIEQILKKYLPVKEGLQKEIMEAMEYSLLAGGKRLRPMLMRETYVLFGGDEELIEPFMAAIEMIHTCLLYTSNLVLLLIYLVELVILNFLIPFVQVYIVVKVMNNLSEEDYLSKFAELCETVIAWTLKTLLAGVTGVNIIQGLLSPAIDSLKRSVVGRSAEAIPVVGDAIGGVTEVMLGTAVLIKNGIGVAGALVCIGICLVPMIQMAVVTLLYKLIAAMIQPVSDKRIVGCISLSLIHI